MILDQAAAFSNAQVFSAVTAGIYQSDNWIDLGQFTDAKGVVSSPDIAAGEQLYVHFRAASGFSSSTFNVAAAFRAVVFIDDVSPPSSGNATAVFLPASHEIVNQLGVGFAVSLAAGQTFTLPIASPQGGALNPQNSLLSRSLGKRYMRVAYQFSGTGTFSGAIDAILTKDSMSPGVPMPGSKYVGGIYPASVDIG